jgi:hypothetical protein
MLNSTVTKYVDAALAQSRRQDNMRWPGKVPEPMRDTTIAPAGDWIGWKSIPSTVTDADLNALEKETGLGFPSLYRDFLQYRHFVTLTETGLRFERHLCNQWQETLRSAYFHSWPRERILDVGLLPFGSETFMDAGSVCFDTRYRTAEGDCPVVYWDHEWVKTDREVQPMFSSSAKMFECLEMVAAADIDFIYHDDTDDPLLLEKKQKLLARFLAIDPDGAGGAARSYWTSWGVKPVV